MVEFIFWLPIIPQSKKYLGKDVKMKATEHCLVGTLIATNNNKMTLVNRTGEIEFDLNNIYYIELIGIK